MLGYIPSPSQGVWHLGPLPIRAYALGIVIGAIMAIWIGQKRLSDRGGRPGLMGDIAMWAIPAGIIGARLYHVITDAELYFGANGHPIDALKIWSGGLGIWGAIAGGAFGAWLACRHYGIPFLTVADSLAPGLLVAQAIGRWGNYFNQELFGGPTDLPWGLKIDPSFRPEGYIQYDTFHPTFLYESLWCFAAAGLIILLDRRYHFVAGRMFALYVMVYTLGRFWIEHMRIDFAHHFFGMRLNDWTSLLLFALSLAYFVATRHHRQESAHDADQP